MTVMTMRWYVIHVYSGFEKKVASSIREQAVHKLGIGEQFEDVLVPTEEVVAGSSRGKKVQGRAQVLPGLCPGQDGDHRSMTWHLVKNTAEGDRLPWRWQAGPMPISEAEAMRIINQMSGGR